MKTSAAALDAAITHQVAQAFDDVDIEAADAAICDAFIAELGYDYQLRPIDMEGVVRATLEISLAVQERPASDLRRVVRKHIAAAVKRIRSNPRPKAPKSTPVTPNTPSSANATESILRQAASIGQDHRTAQQTLPQIAETLDLIEDAIEDDNVDVKLRAMAEQFFGVGRRYLPTVAKNSGDPELRERSTELLARLIGLEGRLGRD